MDQTQTQQPYNFAPIQSAPTTSQSSFTVSNIPSAPKTQSNASLSLDQDTVNLAKAIRHVESQDNYNAVGKSGEYGAYQFMPDTWSKWSNAYLGQNVPLQSATPAQQNEVAYKHISELRKNGYRLGEIVSMWNSGDPQAYTGTFSDGRSSTSTNSMGVPYNVPKYTTDVANTYQQLKSQTPPPPTNVATPNTPQTPQATQAGLAPQAATDNSWVPLPYKAPNPNDSVVGNGLIAGGKAIVNAVPDLYTLGKGIGGALIHPIKTIEGIGNIGIGGLEEGARAITNNAANIPQSSQEQAFEGFKNVFKDRGEYGLIAHPIQSLTGQNDTLDKLERYTTNHPLQFGLDVVMALQAGAKVADVAKNSLGGLSNAKALLSPTGGGFDPNLGKEVGGDIYNNVSMYDRMIEGKVASPEQVYLDPVNKIYQPQIAQHIIEDAKLALKGAGQEDIASKLGDVLSDTSHISPNDITSTIQGLIDAKGSSISDALKNTISTVGGAPSNILGKIIKGTTSESLGVTTGLGTKTLNKGIEAVTGGPESRAAFNEAKSGDFTPDQIVEEAKTGLDKLYQDRSATYKSQLGQMADNSKTYDISPLHQELSNQLNKFNINVNDEGGLDFSRSKFALDSGAQGDINRLVDYVKGYGLKPGDRTAVGLDNLKQVIGSYYSPNSDYRSFVQGIKSSIWNPQTQSGVLSDVPGYGEMSGNYEDASNYIKDLKSSLSVGDRAGIETTFNKLIGAVKGNNELRNAFVEELNKETGGTLIPHLAGSRFQGLLPVGTSGVLEKAGGIGGALYSVFSGNWSGLAGATIPLITIASPALVGKFLNALGFVGEKASTIMKALNVGTGVVPAASQIRNIPQSTAS